MSMIETPRFAEICVQGSDAASFLHSQLTCDVKSLRPGQCQFGGFCGADGRVLCLLLLARTGDDSFRMLLPEALAQGVIERLQRYRLRARCTLTRAPVQIEAGPVERARDAATRQWTHAGFAWSVRTQAEESLAPPLPTPLWVEQVRLGIPWLLPPTSERFLPQMLGFERLHAFSLRKGCYPGQEVIARTHFLGRSKRRLAHLHAADPAACASVGSDLMARDSGAAAGTLISIDACGNGLAVLLEAATPGMTLVAADGNNMATFVIERDASETIGDISLNGRCEPPSDA